MNQSVLLPSPPGTRQQPLLKDKSPNGGIKQTRGRFAEVAGGTAAECAAICCCFPCSMMNFLILTVYKVPVGLCKKVWKKQRGKRRHIAKKNKAATPTPTAAMVAGATAGIEWPGNDRENEDRGDQSSLPSSYFSSEDMELEKEMWEGFYGTGFWRTSSQREN